MNRSKACWLQQQEIGTNKFNMSLIKRVSKLLDNFHQVFSKSLHDPRASELAFVGVQLKLPEIKHENAILERSILWNTPKHRKTLEKRNMEKYGAKDWGTWKLHERNKKIRVDNKTGEYFEFGRLAPETYKKVMAETAEIQKRIAKAFSPFKPKDKEVIVLYEGENDDKVIKDGKRVIEMEKPRPKFFSANLMQKAIVSEEKSSRTTVKPSGLG